MKKNIILSMVGVAAGLLVASCSAKPESVTAVVAGPDGQPAAVVVKYAKAVSAESVTADAFQIEGQEIEAVFVTDKDITAKPECKGEKPECDKAKAECDSTKACPEAKAECDKAKAECDKAGKPECDKAKAECDKAGKAECDKAKAECDSTKAACPEAKAECDKAKAECKGPKSVDGQFVVIVLKKACPEKPACDKANAECDSTKAACPEAKAECDSTKAACPEAKAECDKAGKPECDGQHKDCAKEGKAAHDCGMDPKECEASNHECCPEDSTKVCPEGKTEKPACPEIAVPEIAVKQVKEIKAADGSALKAWSKAFPATKAVPCFGPKGPKHHHGEACPEGKAECDKAKAECDGQHKDCPKAEEAK